MFLMILRCGVWFFLMFACFGAEKSREEILREEGKAVAEKSLKIAEQFYQMEKGEELREITQAVLDSPDTSDLLKQKILSSNRRFFLFSYPSDGFRVKGYVSFVPNPSENPLLIFLRGGNRMLGLMHPTTDYSCVRNYTIIATAFRGGVSEGEDQWGGDEVNDVENLLLYFPQLADKLQVSFNPSKIFLLGGSRGGMEMFLALGRSAFLQQQVDKAVSLSGLLDMRECLSDRPGMKRMFIRDFGLIPGQNEEEWIAHRDPIRTVSNIRKDLPFLIIQGTEDLRVSLPTGLHMVEKLKEHGHTVDYWEIPKGSHCLTNQPNRMDLIADWLEK